MERTTSTSVSVWLDSKTITENTKPTFVQWTVSPLVSKVVFGTRVLRAFVTVPRWTRTICSWLEARSGKQQELNRPEFRMLMDDVRHSSHSVLQPLPDDLVPFWERAPESSIMYDDAVVHLLSGLRGLERVVSVCLNYLQTEVFPEETMFYLSVDLNRVIIKVNPPCSFEGFLTKLEEFDTWFRDTFPDVDSIDVTYTFRKM